MKSMRSRAGATWVPLASVLMVLSLMAIDTESRADPIHSGSWARIIEVDQAACRANMQALSDALEIYFAENGVYTDPFGLDESGVLPDAQELCCPFDGSAYTVAFSRDSYLVACSCRHDHGRITDGESSW